MCGEIRPPVLKHPISFVPGSARHSSALCLSHSNCINVSYVCCSYSPDGIVNSENVNTVCDEMYTDANCVTNVNHMSHMNEPIELITLSTQIDPIEVARADGSDASICETDSNTSCSDLTSSIEINSLANSSIEPSDSEGPCSDVSMNANNREDTSSEVSAEDCNSNISSLQQTLSCVALNVCGIKSKLIFPEFISFINKHDIICFSESKLADTDTVEIEGYTAFYKNRDIYRRKSGGLLLLVRNCYLKHIRIYEETRFKHKIPNELLIYYSFVSFELCKSTQWFSCDEHILGSKTLFCSVYIECEGSKYFNRHAYDEIEEAMIMFDFENVCIMGDFNSRTGGMSDLITNIESVDSPFDFNIYDLPERISLDTHTNTMGYQFISFCKSCQLATANGRLNGDNPGKLTCKNASVVDYVLLSHSLFDHAIDFTVLDFNELFSDVHAPINIVFKCPNEFVQTNEEIAHDKFTSK